MLKDYVFCFLNHYQVRNKNNGYKLVSFLFIYAQDELFDISLFCNYHLDPSLKCKYGRNLLHESSRDGDIAIIETMLSHGLDINSKDSDGDTPLMIAALNGKMEAVNYLLDKGADPFLKGDNGRNQEP